MMKARLEIRLTEEDKEAFAMAMQKSGDRSTSAWLLRVGRVTARELLCSTSVTMANVRARILVGANGPAQTSLFAMFAESLRDKEGDGG